jgi:arginine-tRNA-protein transferase
MPLRLPVRRLSPVELAPRLAAGDRRSGPLLYRPTCPRCDACRALRIEVEQFDWRCRLRRILRRNYRRLHVELGPPLADARRVALYNAHLEGRGLAREAPMDLERYRQSLTESCCDSFELRYLLDGQLVGVAIGDRASDALSAVSCYYDPGLRALSLGTYSILKQLELARAWGLRWLYLGLYVIGCDAMAYKATFHPHEQLEGERWVRKERPA